MSLDKFVLEVLREFDVIHKKKLSKRDSMVEVNLDKRKIYLKKDAPGYGKDVYLLYGIAEVYYRFYHRNDTATKEDKLELAKKWYSQIYADLTEKD